MVKTYYHFYLYKDNRLQKFGKTTNKNYILNLIKYKGQRKRYNLKIIKNNSVIFNNIFK